MELKNLYTVKKIIETGSYQNAAAALNYAQSTITFQIKQLESELGIKLFEKNGARMELTQAGRELLPVMDKVLLAVDELLSYNADRDRLRGTLTIALPESLITYKMQPVLKAFKEKAPNVRLALQVMNCYKIYECLMNGEADIAIHYDVGKYPSGFAVSALGSYPLVLVGAPCAEEDFVSPGQVKNICHIQNDPNALYLKIFQRYLRQKNIVLQADLEVWSIEAVKRSAASNLGVAFLPYFAVESELKRGELKELRTDMEHPSMTAVCAYNKNKWQSPAMLLFLKLLDGLFDK